MLDISMNLFKYLNTFFESISGPAYVMSVNALTICLDVPIPNSNIWIQDRGSGKSFFLQKLAESNPKYFVVLPDKLFESAILDFPKEWFDNKVWIHDDLITALHGLTTKQRQQLTGFFVEFLSKGKYSRVEKQQRSSSVEGRISCIFPMASENYSKYGRELYDQTLVPERLVPITYKLSVSEIYSIADRIINDNQEYNEIRIELPFTPDKVKVDIPRSLNEEIKRIATYLHLSTKLSIARAVIYVSNWLMANALLNRRYKVIKYDVELLKILINVHAIGRDTAESDIRSYIAQCYLENKEIKLRDIYQKFSEKYHQKTIKKVLSILSDILGLEL